MSCSVVLRTIDGAVDFLMEELRALPSVQTIRSTSPVTVECSVDGPVDDLVGCALYSSIAVVLPDGQLDEIPRLGWMRRFGHLERLPWATNLVAAEVLVRLAKVRPKDRLLDPFCGTGTILRAARRREPAAVISGSDHDPRALALAARNCREQATIAAADAEALPVRSGVVDRVVSNLPFGKQVGSHRANRSLYPAVLQELDRVLTPDGRVVLLTEDKRLLEAAVQRQRALKVVRRRLLKYNGATPTAYVLTRTR
jgi:SAM-dependent methyltransferase